MLFLHLQQIPQIAVQIFEHRNHPIRLFFRLADELDALRDHLVVISPKIVGVDEEIYSPACLIADERFLLWLGRFR